MQIFPTELAALRKTSQPPHLLDVRETEEHELVALPGSMLIPLGQLFVRAAEIAAWKDEEIIVYCHHGIRSLHAIQLLQGLGFTKLLNLSGGIDGWAREVEPAMRRY